MRIKVLSSYLSRHIEFHVLWIKKKHISGQEHCFDTVESCWESDLTNKYILRSLGCLNLTGGVLTFLICGMFAVTVFRLCNDCCKLSFLSPAPLFLCLLPHASRPSAFQNMPQMESLLAGYARGCIAHENHWVTGPV